MEPGRIVVRGKDLLKPPLLESTEANIIEIYSANKELVAFLVRIFTDDTWGLCTKQDPDWPEMCLRYGFSSLKSGAPVKTLLKEGIRPYV